MNLGTETIMPMAGTFNAHLKDIIGFDQAALLKLVAFTDSRKPLKTFAHAVFRLSATFFGAFYCFGGVYLLVRKDPAIGMYIAAPLACLLTCGALRRLIRRKRPYARFNFAILPDVNRPGKYSFPSRHAASSIITAFAVMTVNPVIGLALLSMAAPVGLSRVLLGAHYPLDIFAGWLLGAVFGAAGFYTIRL